MLKVLHFISSLLSSQYALSHLLFSPPSGAKLEVIVPSESTCGREQSKVAYSTIMIYCNPSAGVGIPEFMMETDECQYMFMWHSNAVCGLT